MDTECSVQIHPAKVGCRKARNLSTFPLQHACEIGASKGTPTAGSGIHHRWESSGATPNVPRYAVLKGRGRRVARAEGAKQSSPSESAAALMCLQIVENIELVLMAASCLQTVSSTIS